MANGGTGETTGGELVRAFLEATDHLIDPQARADELRGKVSVGTVRRWLREREAEEPHPNPQPRTQQALADYLNSPAAAGGEEYRRGYADALRALRARVDELADAIGAPLMPPDRFRPEGDDGV